MSKLIDLTGERFGRWTVIKRGENKNKAVRWVCICSCDKSKTVLVNSSSLIRGFSLSCGCLNIESTKTHGMSNERVYKIFKGMKGRCYNKNNPGYKDWGGRGVKICEEWINNPKAFIDWALKNGYKDDLEIDRIDNDGNYEPDNCRFVTHRQNNLNKKIIQRNNTTNYRGVSWNKRNSKYESYTDFMKK